MIVTTNWISENYTKFNNLYWNGTLPEISFKVNRSRKNWGFASYRYDFVNDTIHPLAITLSNYYDSPENVKIQTLLHEMIHIADYTFHPEHFIKNHRIVSRRSYDAHGKWFLEMADRISKESGYKVTNYVTSEEVGVSCLSEKSKKCLENKQNNAVICVVYGTSGMNFYFKTDIWKMKNLEKTINRYTFYRIGDIKKVKYYSFKDPQLAGLRSCGTYLKGWFLNNIDMKCKLKEINATEIHS